MFVASQRMPNLSFTFDPSSEGVVGVQESLGDLTPEFQHPIQNVKQGGNGYLFFPVFGMIRPGIKPRHIFYLYAACQFNIELYLRLLQVKCNTCNLCANSTQKDPRAKDRAHPPTHHPHDIALLN